MLGMSGGIDSSMSAVLLQKKGYHVIGVTFLTWCNESSDIPKFINDAAGVASKLGIKHIVHDIREKFKENIIDLYHV